MNRFEPEFEDLYLRLAKIHWGQQMSLEELAYMELPVSFAIMTSILEQLYIIAPEEWAQQLGILIPSDNYLAQIAVILNNLPESMEYILRTDSPEFRLWTPNLRQFSMRELIEASGVIPMGWNRIDLERQIRTLRNGTHRFLRRDTPDGMICVGNLSRYRVEPENKEKFQIIVSKMFRCLMLGIGNREDFKKTPQELNNEIQAQH